jgi:hypothetical protein
MNDCPQFTINKCTDHDETGLETIKINTDSNKSGKLKFLIDTGAEISIVKDTSMNPGIIYESTKKIYLKGISDVILKTEGTTTLKLLTSTHETTHVFHTVGSDFGCHYDGILGQDFWKKYKATINYSDRTITMSDVVLKFDNKTNETKNETYKLILKPRTESIVRLPTKSKGLGIIPKGEIIPGVHLAESLTEEINGYCVTSIVNTLEKEITIDASQVNLEKMDDECNETVLLLPSSEVKSNDRLNCELS